MRLSTLLLFGAVNVICGQELVMSGAGSGDFDTKPIQQTIIISEVDTEPGDDQEIFFSGDSSTGGIPRVVDGSGDEPGPTDPNIKCSDDYCWCVDAQGAQLVDTRKIKSSGMPSCPPAQRVDTMPTTVLPLRTLPSEAQETVAPVDTDFTTMRIEDKSTSRPQPPYIIKTDGDVTPEKPVKDGRPEEPSDIDGWTGGDVERIPVEPIKPILTHPGILAAVIGGGVVGLLCAVLLVMFIVYRMRKKDEGSYPLDDSKPRLHGGYQKAPTKEYYA